MYKKIIVVYPMHSSTHNPFVKLLVDRLKKDYIIEAGLRMLLHKNCFYDIIHIHWPEAIFNWVAPNEAQLDGLDELLAFRKKQGSKIIYTRHNIRPHYTANKNMDRLYGIIEKNSHCIVHLGNWSKNEFITNNTVKASHAIIFHHLYESYKSPWITKERARDYFKIRHDKLVILSFGNFRSREEKEWTLKAFHAIECEDKLLIAPCFGEPVSFDTKEENGDCLLDNKFVDDDELPYYFMVADIVFIQRIHILNSGNLPMAFLFNKTVVGPDTGNVREILQKSGNFTCIPGDVKSAQKAFGEAICKLNAGACRNYEYAARRWSIKRIANQYRNLFNQQIHES
jgi:glycosyltransferase involved in cell wall biosynthesis